MKLLLHFILATSAIVSLSAETLSFDFADPKGVNTINFNMDAPLESINGYAKGVSGRVQFDPSAPEKTTGIIEIDTTSLHVANPTMNGHMLGSQWMDVINHPSIQFKVAILKNIETTGNITSAEIIGELTVKGVTRQITTNVTLTYLKGKLKARMGPRGPDGDLLVLRTKFSIFRSDFGIASGDNTEKVAEEIEISLSLAGQSIY
jgi:polyisoprenoid-binding protein YceI